MTRYASSVNFTSDETKHAVRERVGTIVGTRGPIPLAFWTPETSCAQRLILVGHGASGTKLEGYVVSLARALVRTHQCAVVAIDGPVHGDRGTSGAASFLNFGQLWAGDPAMTDSMIEDWQTTMNALLSTDDVETDALVGYWGLSMGTILGLPLVAAERRISAAVLGLMGTTGPTKERLSADAARIEVPTMFLVQWNDELIRRDEAINLFGLIGSTDKCLIATPGSHGQVTVENFHRSAAFLANRLKVPAAASK